MIDKVQRRHLLDKCYQQEFKKAGHQGKMGHNSQQRFVRKARSGLFEIAEYGSLNAVDDVCFVSEVRHLITLEAI